MFDLAKIPPGTALITGATGQDGHYASQRLLAHGWEVHGTVRSSKAANYRTLSSVHHVDMRDMKGLSECVLAVRPDVVLNFGAMSSVGESWKFPVEAMEVSATAVVQMLDACLRLQDLRGQPVRFFQASSGEIFGNSHIVPQNEATPHAPISPYGLAKSAAARAVALYRSEGLFAASGILYNHESVRRDPKFVTRKISQGVARIAAGKQHKLSLGNLDPLRDFTWAEDVVDAVFRILFSTTPNDYVVASNESHSIQEFLELSFEIAGISKWENYVDIEPSLVRSSESLEMRGDFSKISDELGWLPKHSFEDIVRLMTENDLKLEAM